MTLAESKQLIEWAKELGLKRVRSGTFEVEFYPKHEPMNFDPKSLAKTLTDSIPPDSEMLFASSEGIPSVDNPKPEQREITDMN